jgi:hypothetical protein
MAVMRSLLVSESQRCGDIIARTAADGTHAGFSASMGAGATTQGEPITDDIYLGKNE